MTFLDSLKVKPLPPTKFAGGFDCGEPDLTEYLTDGTAWTDQQASFSRTYLLYSGDELVGYFTVLADSIRLETKERPDGVRYQTAPAIKLGRMAVQNEFKKRQIGEWILDYVVGLARSLSATVGIRYVTLDALNDNLAVWYSRYGFQRNKGESKLQIAWRQKIKKWKDGDKLRMVSMRFDILFGEELTIR